jgi:hypothetical protein
MLRFQAKRFVYVCKHLALFQEVARDDAQTRPGETISQKVQESVGGLLDKLEKDCADLGFTFAIKEIERTRHDLATCTYGDLSARAGELLRRAEDEMDGPLFMVIPTNKARYYSGPTLLWGQVTDRFPELVEDIFEAGKCFAAGRNTATVFHLMRVLEFAVQRFATKLRLPKDLHQKTWGVILQEIDAKLKNARPKTATGKTNHTRLSLIAGHLHHVKNAWRNPTMHPKQTYSEEEAESVFTAVRDLMINLTGIL